jgi:hypothetical protein
MDLVNALCLRCAAAPPAAAAATAAGALPAVTTAAALPATAAAAAVADHVEAVCCSLARTIFLTKSRLCVQAVEARA